MLKVRFWDNFGTMLKFWDTLGEIRAFFHAFFRSSTSAMHSLAFALFSSMMWL